MYTASAGRNGREMPVPFLRRNTAAVTLWEGDQYHETV